MFLLTYSSENVRAGGAQINQISCRLAQQLSVRHYSLKDEGYLSGEKMAETKEKQVRRHMLSHSLNTVFSA